MCHAVVVEVLKVVIDITRACVDDIAKILVVTETIIASVVVDVVRIVYLSDAGSGHGSVRCLVFSVQRRRKQQCVKTNRQRHSGR